MKRTDTSASPIYVAAIAVLLGVATIVFFSGWGVVPFADLSKLKSGMTKEEVERFLGRPTHQSFAFVYYDYVATWRRFRVVMTYDLNGMYHGYNIDMGWKFR